MRRVANLFPRILERDNLRLAFWKAVKGHRGTRSARDFAENLETNLLTIRDELAAGSFRWGEAFEFTIHDPKERRITAPCFRERVAHHAIMNLCEPVFERYLIHDSYACRQGKGRDAALKRARGFAARSAWFLKIDIRKYFESIPHHLLLERLARIYKEDHLLEMFERIIRCRDLTGVGRGIPIGSLTSQHFANFYLGTLDRFTKESLHVPCYVRYMDDSLIWGKTGDSVKATLMEIEVFVRDSLDLRLKDVPYINKTSHGVDFLGFRVFPTRLTLNRRSRRRFLEKLRRNHADLRNGDISEAEFQHKTTALVAFTKAAGASSWQWRTRVLQEVLDTAEGHEPREPWGRLEQQRQELPVREPQ